MNAIRLPMLSSPRLHEIATLRIRVKRTGVVTDSKRRTERYSRLGREARDVRHRALIGASTLRWRRRGCDCETDSKSSSGYGSIRESRSRFGVERQGSNAVLSLVGLPVSPVALKNSMESSCTDGLNKHNMPMSIGSDRSTLSRCMTFRFGRMGLSPKMNEILHQTVSRRSAAWWKHHNSRMHGSTTIFCTRDAYSRNRPQADSCASGVPQSSCYSHKPRRTRHKK